MIVLSKNKTIYCFHVTVFTRVICLGSEKDYCVKNFPSVSIPHPVCSFFLFIPFSLTRWNPHPVPLAALEGAQNKGGATKGLLVPAHCVVYRLSLLLPPWSPSVLRSGGGQAGADGSETTGVHPNLPGTMAVESTKEERWHKNPWGLKQWRLKCSLLKNNRGMYSKKNMIKFPYHWASFPQRSWLRIHTGLYSEKYPFGSVSAYLNLVCTSLVGAKPVAFEANDTELYCNSLLYPRLEGSLEHIP